MLLVGFLCFDQIPSCGFTFAAGRLPVRGHIAEAFFDSEFLDFGGPFVSSRSLVMAVLQTTMRILVPSMGTGGALGGVSGILLGDRLARGEFCLPAKEFVGPLGSFVTR